MNKEDYNKLSTYDRIDYDIQMELYQEFNNKIATINDHLGEIYGYSDLKDAEEAEMEAEIQKYMKALKDKCECLDKAIEWIRMVQGGNNTKYLEPIINTDELDNLLNILEKGE